MPSAEVQIALASADLLAGDDVLLVGFVGPELPEALADRGSAVVSFHQNLRAHHLTPGSAFGEWLTDGMFDVAAVTLPKERGRLDLQLAMVGPLVRRGGKVLIAGHNDAGIRSAGKHLRAVFGNADVLDYRYHARLLTATVDEQVPDSSLDAWRTESTVDLAGASATLVSYPGVFAHRMLDDGTRLLLETARVPADARVLDVGCGSGAIATWAARAGGAVDAVDVDALAVCATRETLERSGATAQVWASDVYSDVPERYARILANPPFHAGVRTSSGIAERIISEAPQRLERHGELWLVANRFLDYPSLLNETFGHVEIAAEDKRYRVYRAWSTTR